MNDDKAECGKLSTLLQQLGQDLDQYLQFDYPDAMQNASRWHQALEQPLPEEGIGIQNVMAEMGRHLIPNGSPIPHPGCTAFITTGTTSIGALANLASAVAAPQRMSLTAFNFLEELSLQWMVEMFELPPEMKGLYSSGGSIANIVALGAARQQTFEQRLGIDPGKEGIQHPCRIYATEASHHTIHRAAAVLGLGRNAVITIASDTIGRMSTEALQRQLEVDASTPFVPVAIVANAGTTSTGTIDPLRKIGEIAHHYSIWFHIDGAYGLPGILDPQIHHLYDGLSLADSVIVDPHKWLGAPVGIGATFVRDRNILQRAFTQEATDYLEGSMTNNDIQHSMDNLGVPYSDFGLELSAPSRGAVVWALIREIGKTGLRERVCRHNAMARHIAKRAHAHPNLEVVQEPTLSICCFRYITNEWANLNELNQRIHRQLVHNNRNIPSTALVRGILAIRPCFIGARTTWQHANDLVDEVIDIGQNITNRKNHK
ncbi:MAG: aminotransferase class V-fold PLP-dependent enzyme [Gammaproteobacteria bacterium]|nr:aminotransferase class V-fold PLP-dependent enzyme [Gammaproteobacteria bacterium]